ncbi:MAG: hypothetical protein ACPGTO_05705 [Polaribacter sp.]
MIFFEEKTKLSKKKFEEWTDFDRMNLEPPGWGHKYRRALFIAGCKYLGMDKTKVENLLEIGIHSLLQSSSIQLDGNILEKVKMDPAILSEQERLIKEITNSTKYKKEDINDEYYFNVQLGGNRAKGEMWKQALKFWEWSDEYSATWEMAFNELTWAVRSTRVKCHYKTNIEGEITLAYSFSDTLDLRPDWVNRSMEYNAICYVLGFLYHDALGGNDELEITAQWKTKLNY